VVRLLPCAHKVDRPSGSLVALVRPGPDADPGEGVDDAVELLAQGATLVVNPSTRSFTTSYNLSPPGLWRFFGRIPSVPADLF
jgi:hypothetical protein